MTQVSSRLNSKIQLLSSHTWALDMGKIWMGRICVPGLRTILALANLTFTQRLRGNRRPYLRMRTRLASMW